MPDSERRQSGGDTYSSRAYYDSADRRGPARTLRFLKAHSTEYLSGRDLGDVLGISRVAVWKHIRTLRSLGYDIESRQKVGYRLRGSSGEPYPWEITEGIGTGTVGRRAYYYDDVGTAGSTQDVAAALAGTPGNDGAVVISATQSNARGRIGKRWASPRGGIWMSVVLHPDCRASAASLLPIAAGVAVAESIEEACGIKPELRWPNDVTIQGRKVAGIITEAEMELDRIQNVRLGIGVNFDVDAKSIEKTFAGTPGFYGAASLKQEAESAGAPRTPSKVVLVRGMLRRLDAAYGMLLGGRTKAITSEWAKRSSTIGRTVTGTVDGQRVTGTATRINDSGMLVVRTDGPGRGGRRQVELMAGSLEYAT
ncbi:MAG: biotin--[acetyl-CoA-carboxylase] ligase [Thaumarchaeota archaeon]|nr:biotin--[acetyl-CoA-carboxylase] ligase [Nitrososphaerota archaeon]MDE0526808.1 biotin--[acetyl-CoA-carboxylase] ligase [Nitrososphaerota archaeon]